MRTIPDNSMDVIDSRDIIARIDDLESEATDDTNVEIGEANEALKEWKEENLKELESLKSLAEEGEGSPDWNYGETLIRDTYFEDYAQELAEDIGAINNDMTWPNTCIDWERAARELQMDYMCIDFDGVDYWIRG